MIAIRSLGFASALLVGVGCMHLQPVGPMAATLGVKEPTTNPSSLTTPSIPEPTPEPQMIPAPTPPAPSLLVTPEEIDSSNADEMIQRLKKELETDRQAIDAMPNYSIVSQLSGRR